GAGEVTANLPARREFKAKVVGSDEQYDVALLKIEAKGLPTVRLGDSNTLKPGQWVVAIGSPFGLDHSVTAGIVSATGRSNPYADQRYVPFIQTDVAINQGNSGGPLLNTRGEVVGINSQIFSASGGYMGISFAIPIDLA
ncbi:peptidase S1, partial [Pseudomonas syringae]|uniref:S1C family serine protease n=1 Tax=Pseudomonas syringae TaxID=317 RepID=UPI0010116A1A